MIHRSMSVAEVIKKLKEVKKQIGGNKDVFVGTTPIRDIQIVDEKVIILLKHT